MKADAGLPLPAAVVADLFAGDSAALYVDVRTVAEFAAGHPRLQAVNLPVEFYRPVDQAVFPNDSFLLVADHALRRDARLVVGADDGDRAPRAARLLRAHGFEQVQLLADGIEGWRRAGVPCTGDNRPGVSYASLLLAAKRAPSAPSASAHGARQAAE